ncbi:hypothetical protein BGL34_04110 [Fructilactobacillus lindneri]|uniref:Msa protein n=1 Tax=Fructilactobacillus lindneri DSM 20690 = JCM 11027 TaxID=1122148 RepID=A0A0R2JNX7_9LACO|nr:KxYKxGKxW signal peptide domain-containing protein [Fructilactobacillus lindneri]KRN78867.1 msa protein [Fructilactobacillus lindneri DSM 20690 = JCM 11027]POH06334.1 hypothetical protein BGL35_02950 [Fructilactobacillus lindneri]POH07067.1 hypothetical protein BGL34_04110 [Fructilactobacillus lindneri]POH23874.1 hypothetical protein BHU33_02950 [Fructilactobacillus lindneri DSM 20690 = JCM 11027]SJZ84537.1 KxYKxGKxW signal peptide containing protein [Fructilactobacillus lindneri DSM 20690 
MSRFNEKRREALFENNKKVRYRMYKAGKQWLVSGTATVTGIVASLFLGAPTTLADATQQIAKQAENQNNLLVNKQQETIPATSESTSSQSTSDSSTSTDSHSSDEDKVAPSKSTSVSQSQSFSEHDNGKSTNDLQTDNNVEESKFVKSNLDSESFNDSDAPDRNTSFRKSSIDKIDTAVKQPISTNQSVSSADSDNLSDDNNSTSAKSNQDSHSDSVIENRLFAQSNNESNTQSDSNADRNASISESSSQLADSQLQVSQQSSMSEQIQQSLSAQQSTSISEDSQNQLENAVTNFAAQPQQFNSDPNVDPETGETLINKDNFLDYFNLNGSAKYDPDTGTVTITEAENGQVGSFSLKTAINVNQSFTLDGEVYFGLGADGMGFAFHPGNIDELGDSGQGLGIAGLLDAFGFKLDGYYNGADKPDEPPADANGNPIGYGTINKPYGGFVNTNSKGDPTLDQNSVQWLNKPWQTLPFHLAYNVTNREMTIEYNGLTWSKIVDTSLSVFSIFSKCF